MYNYGDMCSGMTGDRLDVNYVGNYIRPGPNSNLGRGIIVFTDTANAAYYVEGNVVEGNKAATKTTVSCSIGRNSKARNSSSARQNHFPLLTAKPFPPGKPSTRY